MGKRIPLPLNNLAAKPLTISPLDILPLKNGIKSFKNLLILFLRKETFLDSTTKIFKYFL